jgi:hypothetical protein
VDWLAATLFILATGSPVKAQKTAQEIMEGVEKRLRSESLSRVDYAEQYRQYLRDCCVTKSDVIFEIETRSTKSSFFRNQQDILIVRCETEACVANSVGFLELAGEKKLKELGFRLFMVGTINKRRYRAYDIEKKQWIRNRVEFCSPSESCTLAER